MPTPTPETQMGERTHTAAPPVADCPSCGGSGETPHGQRCVCTYNRDRAPTVRPSVTTREHVWLSDEFSVPRDQLCMHRPPSPNADHGCVRMKGHPGRHEYLMLTEPGVIRDYSAQERRASTSSEPR